VKYKHYKAYLSRVGGLLFWIIVLFIFISVRSLDIASTYWLKEWTRYYESSSISRPTWAVSSLSGPLSTNQYLAVYAGINSLTLLLITVRFSVVFWGGLKASKTIYVELLHRVFRSPLRFFDKTPVGRILNRFSKDFDTIDIDVAPSTAEFIFQALQAISIVFVAVSVLPIFVIPMLLLVAINIVYGKRFTNASREFNRISSVSRSPLFNHFSETIAGISTVRAFGISKEFMLDMIYKIDFSSRPMYYGWIVTRWISVRVSGLGALVSFFVATVILFNLDHIDAATTGFCLNYVLLFSDMV
jgi:ABC-type multidrug transport system fused ATPase/permease subunit